MKLLFGGVRGSSSRSGDQYARYGGDTTCLGVVGAAGEPVVIDLGSGVQAVSDWLPLTTDRRELLVLFTHYHLDHVCGIGGFGPLYADDWRIRMAAPAHGKLEAESVITRLLGFPFWPLTVDKLAADIRFGTVTGGEPPLRHGELEIRHCPVRHPDGCTAYRLDEPGGASVVFATDLEWRRSRPEEQAAFLDLCRAGSPVRLLVMDGQFAADEYAAHGGWGHSGLDDVAAVAEAAGVERLLVTHHSPENDDDRLDELEAELQALLPTAALARQGQELTLGE